MNNNRFVNLHTPTSNNNAVNRVSYLALYLLVVRYQKHTVKGNILRKIELCRFSFATYVKTLIELSSHLRGVPFAKQLFTPIENCRQYYPTHVFLH